MMSAPLENNEQHFCNIFIGETSIQVEEIAPENPNPAPHASGIVSIDIY